ncbi:MAG: TIGR00159 family protein [Cyanobacteria bacterium QS_8_64_29]|nr:MAG: TIGR00159 family protein [Cyanobacteria bacterium QS_8_64_29]
MPPAASPDDPSSWSFWLTYGLDIGLVLALAYGLLLVIGERRTLWMVRGAFALLVGLRLAAMGSSWLGLAVLPFVLDKLVLATIVAMALMFQSELRYFLEQLGRGELASVFPSSRRPNAQPNSAFEEIVSAIKDLSQHRTGALVILETSGAIDKRDFSVPGVPINAEVSKELLQSIFQTTSRLHDGATLIRGYRIVSAGIILPLSERAASRQLGTRHRAAMGITERVANCLCIVVSEETGAISLAEKGTLYRPLTRSKLKELLETKLAAPGDRDAVAGGLNRLRRRVGSDRLLRRRKRASSPPSSGRQSGS